MAEITHKTQKWLRLAHWRQLQKEEQKRWSDMVKTWQK